MQEGVYQKYIYKFYYLRVNRMDGALLVISKLALFIFSKTPYYLDLVHKLKNKWKQWILYVKNVCYDPSRNDQSFFGVIFIYFFLGGG